MGLISSYIPLSSESIVAVLNAETGEEIFLDTDRQNLVSKLLGVSNKAQPMNLSVQNDSRTFSHPLDNKKTMIDHKIDLPIQISITMSIVNDTQSVIYNQIESYKRLVTECSVRTKAQTYDRLIVASCSHRESPDFFNALLMTINFIEYQKALSVEDPETELPSQSSIQAIGQVALDFIL